MLQAVFRRAGARGLIYDFQLLSCGIRLLIFQLCSDRILICLIRSLIYYNSIYIVSWVHCSNSHEFPLGTHLCRFESLSPNEKSARWSFEEEKEGLWGRAKVSPLGSGKHLNPCRDKEKKGVFLDREVPLFFSWHLWLAVKGWQVGKNLLFFNPRVCLRAYVALQESQYNIK